MSTTKRLSVLFLLKEGDALSEFINTEDMHWVVDMNNICTLALHTSILIVTTVVATQRETEAKVQTGLRSTTGHIIHMYWARSLPKIGSTVCNSS